MLVYSIPLSLSIQMRLYHLKIHTTIQNNCHCCLEGVDDDTFDFFPISYLLYNIYIIMLSILILCKYLLLSTDEMSLFNTNHRHNHNYNEIIDWIIVYSLILLSIWESLFNFYRFYSTYYASKKVQILASYKIMIKFTIFWIPFLCIFLLQIHLFYYLYPIIILCYFIFNVLNVWLFGHILIVQYRFMMG